MAAVLQKAGGDGIFAVPAGRNLAVEQRSKRCPLFVRGNATRNERQERLVDGMQCLSAAHQVFPVRRPLRRECGEDRREAVKQLALRQSIHGCLMLELSRAAKRELGRIVRCVHRKIAPARYSHSLPRLIPTRARLLLLFRTWVSHALSLLHNPELSRAAKRRRPE